MLNEKETWEIKYLSEVRPLASKVRRVVQHFLSKLSVTVSCPQLVNQRSV